MLTPRTQNLVPTWWTNLSVREKILGGLSVCLIVGNLIAFAGQLSRNTATRQERPYIFLGYKFLGLQEILVGHERIGYLTDKDMDERVAAMEFAQAEYALAPVTLDLNNPAYEYILLNFSHPAPALAKVKELGLVVWKQNQFGVILAKNPQFQNP